MFNYCILAYFVLLVKKLKTPFEPAFMKLSNEAKSNWCGVSFWFNNRLEKHARSYKQTLNRLQSTEGKGHQLQFLQCSSDPVWCYEERFQEPYLATEEKRRFEQTTTMWDNELKKWDAEGSLRSSLYCKKWGRVLTVSLRTLESERGMRSTARREAEVMRVTEQNPSPLLPASPVGGLRF